MNSVRTLRAIEANEAASSGEIRRNIISLGGTDKHRLLYIRVEELDALHKFRIEVDVSPDRLVIDWCAQVSTRA